MPKRRRPGEWEVLYFEVEARLRLKDRLAQLAADNDRSPTRELQRLLDAALPPLREAPPRTEDGP